MFGFGSNPNEIRVCSSHPEKVVPLIWTFAFRGAEYWCPYCGRNYDCLSGRREFKTDELEQELEEWKKRTRSFLGARSALVCDRLKYKGKLISPDELPEKVRERYIRICREWEYDADKEHAA